MRRVPLTAMLSLVKPRLKRGFLTVVWADLKNYWVVSFLDARGG